MKVLLLKVLTDLFQRKIPRLFYIRWNRVLLWLGGVKYGKHCNIYNQIYLTHFKSLSGLSIGDNFVMTSGSGINPLARGTRSHIHLANDAKILIGNNVGVSSIALWSEKEISIGDYTIIGANTTIIDTDAHPLSAQDRLVDLGKGAKVAPIIIGKNVFIGTNCIILKGVSIGNRSIIAAGSVVTKDIPEDCIAAGNPAKVIKHLSSN